MIGGYHQGAVKPTAAGTLVNASAYGATIPVVYGRTKIGVLLTWANNLRQGNCIIKKGKMKDKSGSGKVPTYIEAVDFLLATNPVSGVLQVWSNNNNNYLLDFTMVSQTLNSTSLPSSFVISDSLFYFVIGVTITNPYSETFDDYGGPGSQTLTGNFEVPLWNACLKGPNPTDSSAYRNQPFVFRWKPAYGNTIYVDPWNPLPVIGDQTINIYYARFLNGSVPPIGDLCLTFEPELGDGDEFDDYPLQQIIYPYYAGMGAKALDLGSSGLVPQIRPEIMGMFTFYNTGDADFADMVEDIFTSGMVWTGSQLGEIQHGLNCCDLPGIAQKKVFSSLYGFSPTQFDLANTAGNFLVCYAACRNGGAPLTISDSAGNTWTKLYSTGLAGYATQALWYCTALAADANVVTIGAGEGFNSEILLFEITGADTFDGFNAVAGTGGPATGNLTTSGMPSYALCIPSSGLWSTVDDTTDPVHWNSVVQFDSLTSTAWGWAFDQRISNPATPTFSIELPAGAYPWSVLMLAFKNSQQASYPIPFGDILDHPSLDNVRQQCRAAGLWGSMNMDSQQAASDRLKNLYMSMDAWPVWSGFKLKSIARSEVSAVGNGAVYVAPTASGPVATLTESDFVTEEGKAPVVFKRKAKVDSAPIKQIQCYDRSDIYNQATISQPEAANLTFFGVRKESAEVHEEIQDPSIARQILNVEVLRQCYLPETIVFNLKPKWKLLEAGDLVAFDEPMMAIVGTPVRLLKVQEQKDKTLACESERYIYGLNAPVPLTVDSAIPNNPSTDNDPGNVNTPIFIEPVPRLTNLIGAPELWISVSGMTTDYGGCAVYLSTDGGNSYNPVGTLTGSAITGVTAGDWPANADPDTTHDLSVDLTESLGSLDSYAITDENNFVYPCYVAVGNASIPYELMTYAVATMTAANKYTLKATGSGNYLRRAVFGAPAVGAGVDHPMGSRFAFLDPTGTGILKLPLDPRWVGLTLYFKFTAFNTFINSVQELNDVTAYNYSPTGTTGQDILYNNYSLSPGSPLTQPSGMFKVSMAETDATFPSGAVNYNARNFTVADPGAGNTQIYYVTILDPQFLGDDGVMVNLTSYCETTNAKVGLAGYTFIGSIVVTHAGGANIVQAGGWPQYSASNTPVTEVSANYNISVHDQTVLFTTGASTITGTLPTAVGISGQTFVLKKVDSGAGTAAIATTSSQTIDSQASWVLPNQNQYIAVRSDGANWQIVANN